MKKIVDLTDSSIIWYTTAIILAITGFFVLRLDYLEALEKSKRLEAIETSPTAIPAPIRCQCHSNLCSCSCACQQMSTNSPTTNVP